MTAEGTYLFFIEQIVILISGGDGRLVIYRQKYRFSLLFMLPC
jgi:hypothetical protein